MPWRALYISPTVTDFCRLPGGAAAAAATTAAAVAAAAVADAVGASV
jgi:hypothetical protein